MTLFEVRIYPVVVPVCVQGNRWFRPWAVSGTAKYAASYVYAFPTPFFFFFVLARRRGERQCCVAAGVADKAPCNETGDPK